MAEISASIVKTLRDQTGAGMMECKKALQEADGDMKRAGALLREKGAAKAVKRAGRVAKEGRIQAAISPDKRCGALVEVNIETDFAARSERFVQMVDAICASALHRRCDSLEALLAAKPAGASDAATVGDLVTGLAAIIGENMMVGRCRTLAIEDGKHGLVHSYIHPPGKVGVLVTLCCENDQAASSDAAGDLAHNLCLQIAFSNPMAVDRESIAPDVLAAEREIYRNMTLKEGKPEKVVDKIVEGRLRNFFTESCLLEQVYVKDEKKTISALVTEASKAADGKLEVAAFVRFLLGETAEAAA